MRKENMETKRRNIKERKMNTKKNNRKHERTQVWPMLR